MMVLRDPAKFQQTNKLKLIVKKEFLAAMKAVIHEMGTILTRAPGRSSADSRLLLLN